MTNQSWCNAPFVRFFFNFLFCSFCLTTAYIYFRRCISSLFELFLLFCVYICFPFIFSLLFFILHRTIRWHIHNLYFLDAFLFNMVCANCECDRHFFCLYILLICFMSIAFKLHRVSNIIIDNVFCTTF